ncbi:MAG: CarD family transcriptional regulator [Robiginitomaculum sp.]
MATKKTAASKKAAAGTLAKLKTQRHAFKVDSHIVYPAHGVGKVIAIKQETIAGFDIESYIVEFLQDQMTLRVPTKKAKNLGMRKLANDNVLKDSFTTLKGRARIKRTMWSRRAKEYESKINSGDLILLTEVVRDLHRTEDQPDQSYSERQLYERAIERLVREHAAIQKLDRGVAMEKILDTLTKARTRASEKVEEKKGEEAAA